MPDNSKNDWLVASLTKPEFTLGDFEQVGLTPTNTQLLNEKDYKKSEQIQQMFTNPETGTFDEKQFKLHYDVAAQTFNDFAKKDYDSTLLNNNYFFQENFHAPKDAKRFNSTVNIGKVKNPFNQVSGIEGFTTKTDSGLSVREIAQTQKVQDHLSDDVLDYTPNESGFFGTIFKPSTVLAQWDTDGEHYDEDSGRKIKHSKGEFKYNENGKPYYETLGNREIYGKQVLNGWDVLTEDGSVANKWDFMDSDSKTKSLTGTIFKTAAHVVPMFIPGVGQWYTGITLGHSIMTDLLPVLAKSTAGLFLNEDLKDTGLFKHMNELQAFGAKFGGSVSDEASMSTFNKENLFAMAGDVFGQLAQQRLIAKVPLWLGQSKKEAEAFSAAAAKYGEEGLADMQKALKAYKGPNALQDRANLLRTKYGADEGIAKILDKWDKWSSIGSKSLGVGYMAGISATGMAEEAKLHGLDERDTAALFLGTMAGFGAMMTKFEFAHWALEGMGLDELGGFMKQTIKQRVKEIVPTINRLADASESRVIGAAARNIEQTVAGEIAQAGSEATKASAREKLIKLFNKGKQIGESLTASLGDISTVKQKMLAEALEETSEEAMQDGIKVVYNGMRALGMTSTDKEQGTAFDFKDMGSRYLMSAMGGALGGGIAGVQDKLSGQIHESLPPTLKREIASAVRHGYASQLQEIVDKQRDRGQLGSTSLSIREYVPDNKLNEDINYVPMAPDSDSMSHNDFIHSMISSEIKLAKDAIFQEGLQTDIRLNDIYNERAELFVDFKLNTGIVDDIDYLTNEIIDRKAKINKLEGGVKEGASSESSEDKAKLSSLNKEIETLREELFAITSGERVLKYTKEALFSVNKELHTPFGIETKDSMAMRDYRKKYENLSIVEKEDINTKYQEFSQLEKRKQLRAAHAEFEQLSNEDFNTFIPELANYAKQRQAFVDKFVDLNTSIGILNLKKEEDVDKIDNATLPALNVGALNLDSSKSDIANLADIVRAEKYINPVIYNYVEGQYNIPYKTTRGDDLGSVFADVYGHEEYGLLPQDYDPGQVGLDAIRSATGINVKDLLAKMSPWNYAETLAKLQEVTSHKGFTDMTFSAQDMDYNPVDHNVVVEAFNNALQRTIDFVLNTTTQSNDETLVAPNEARIEEITAIEDIKKSYASKPNNPLLDYIADLTKRQGREGLGNLIDIINSTFNDLSAKGVANDFIIDNKISIEQLEYGQNLLGKLKAVIEASTDWQGPTSDTQIIGYNSAINAIAERSKDEEHEVLNTLTGDDSVTVYNDLILLNSKIDFLLNLHRFNSSGSIREMKLTGATMSTLYLKTLSPGSDLFTHLEELGIDLSEVSSKFGVAKQYSDNLSALESPADSKVALKSDDDSFFKIRSEKDGIEQALYKAVNSRPDREEILNKIFDSLNREEFVKDNTTVDFSSNVRYIPKGQALIYLAQTLTVDPKQFYNDFTGNLTAGENLIQNDPYAPFYGQEHVLKQMYWHMISKLSPVDTQKKVANILLKPDTTFTEEDEALFGIDAHAPTLKNAAILYGIPGAGKTTSALYYLTKIAERYGIDVAVFAPHQEQGDNLKKSLKDRPNVYNENRSVTGLIQSILGDTLYSKIDEDYKNNNVVDYKIGDPIDKISTDSTLMRKSAKSGYSSIVVNPNHPEVAKFLADKSKIISYEGKVPGMIIVDEATHIRGAELDLLNYTVGLHNSNSNQPISLYLVGDREQRGFTMTIDDNKVANNMTVMFGIKTPVLSQSLRNRFNVKNKNINNVRALRKTIESAHSSNNFGGVKSLLDSGLVFDYAIDDIYGLVGERLVTEFTKEDLELMFKNSTETVALITDKESPSLLKLIDTIPGASARLKVHSPDKAQGLEYDNVILDISSTDKRPANLREMPSTYDAIEMLYTMISRSKKGTLIKKPFIKSVTLKDNTEDVVVQKIELDANVIDKYKTFTLDGITKSYSGLEDLNLSPTETRKTPTQADSDTLKSDNVDKEYTDEAYSTVAKQLTTTREDTTLAIDLTGTNRPVSPDETRPITYTFHERLGLEVNSGKLLNTRTNPIIGNQDLAGIYSLMHNEELTADQSFNDPKIQSVRSNIKRLKSGLLAHSRKLANGESVQNIKNFLSLYYKVNENILSKLDFSKARLKVETKEFDPKVDLSYQHREEQAPLKAGGLISYLVMDIPHFNPKSESDRTFLTISAFPNTNNPAVASRKGVMSTMNLIRDNHSRLSNGGVSDFYLKPDVPLSKILNPTSNLYIQSTPLRSLRDFNNEHDNLQVSDPYIVMNSNIISQDNATVQQYFANFNNGAVNEDGSVNSESYSLIGRPVVFVSLDKSVPTNQLADNYVKQLNTQTDKRIKGDSTESDPGTIRMVMLNKKGIDLKSWFAKNAEIAHKLSESDIDVKAQRRAYSNNFAAAGMLGALINFKRRAEYYQANPGSDTIAKSLGLDMSPGSANLLIGQVDGIIKTALPLLTGRTFNDIYGSSTTNSVTSYLEASRSKVDEFANTLFLGEPNAATKAMEHFIASDLLEYISKHEQDGAAQSIIDSTGAKLSLNVPNSALYNFVNALRLTVAGGSFTNNDGVTTRIEGLFPSAFNKSNADTIAYDTMLSGLTSILAYKFPDGIHINPVLRTTSKDNRYEGDAPFVVPTGNVDDDFMVDVEVQTPTIYFDPNSIAFIKPEFVQEQEEAIVEEFKTIKDKVSEILNEEAQNVPEVIAIIDAVQSAMVNDTLLNEESPVKIKEILADSSIEDYTNSVLESALNQIADKIDKLPDDIVRVNGKDSILSADQDGVALTDLKEAATNIAKQELTNLSAPEQNIIVEYTTSNKPGTTEKVREFTITNADNGEIIGNFAYENKRFTDLNYLNLVPANVDKIASLVNGTFVESDYVRLQNVFSSPELASSATLDFKRDISKSYLLVGSFLKVNNYETELQELRNAYDNLLKQIKC